MAHLGDEVAAFVDGQLSASSMQAALAHLATCEACERAVRQQRLLKSRMSTVDAPAPPAALLASLAGMAMVPPPRERWLSRLGRRLPVRAGVFLVGASLAVLAVAYAMGGTDPRVGDEVAPSFDGYVAEFTGTTTVQAGNIISTADMRQLEASGWPCHATLAGLPRQAGKYTDGGQAVALSYGDRNARLTLVEQTGTLARTALAGFTPTLLGGSQVWERPGNPRLVTWDYDGTVYTIVTNLDPARIHQAVSELPKGEKSEGPFGRVGAGLDRMTRWMPAG